MVLMPMPGLEDERSGWYFHWDQVYPLYPVYLDEFDFDYLKLDEPANTRPRLQISLSGRASICQLQQQCEVSQPTLSNSSALCARFPIDKILRTSGSANNPSGIGGMGAGRIGGLPTPCGAVAFMGGRGDAVVGAALVPFPV